MQIAVITPAPPGTRYGNRITAKRWAGILSSLGHEVRIAQDYEGQDSDLLVALHARRSHAALVKFHRLYPDKPLIVALTGTDLYRDLKKSRSAWRSLELATRIIVLQAEALKELPRELQQKTRVIHQSVEPVDSSAPETQPADFRLKSSAFRIPHSAFRICLIGHLRAVKDPFRAALAARRLPADSQIRIVHIGKAMTEAMQRRAEREMQINPRYRWVGELPRAEARRWLDESDL